MPIALRTLFVLLLSFAPFVLVLVQQLSIWRQTSLLGTLPESIHGTKLYIDAKVILDRRFFLNGVTTGTNQSGAWSTVFFWMSLAFLSLIMFTSWNFVIGEPLGDDWYVNTANLFLSGPPSLFTTDTLPPFQRDTLAVSCIAFEVGYVVVIRRLITRLYINEYSALENLADVVHLLSAIIISAVGKILLGNLGPLSTLTIFFAVGTGIRPDFYLSSLGDAAFSALSGAGGPFAGLRNRSKPELAAADMTPSAPLEAIDGVNEDVAERLRRIGISTCHRLSTSNPLVIWGRFPSTLPEVIDWVGQAILLNQCPTQTKDLRSIQVRTIQDLIGRVEARNSDVLNTAKIPVEDVQSFLILTKARLEVAQISELFEALSSDADPAPRGSTGSRNGESGTTGSHGGIGLSSNGATGPSGAAGDPDVTGAGGTAARTALLQVNPLGAWSPGAARETDGGSGVSNTGATGAPVGGDVDSSSIGATGAT